MSFQMRELNRKKRTRKVLQNRDHVRSEACLQCSIRTFLGYAFECPKCKGTGNILTEHFGPVPVDKKQPRLRYFK